MGNTDEMRSVCPRCGNGGIAVMDINETLSMLDELGYPLYYCKVCACAFTALTRPDEPIPRVQIEGTHSLSES